MSNQLIFLTPNQANHEYQTTDYFNHMNQLELTFRLKELHQQPNPHTNLQQQLRTHYQHLTREFTQVEQSVVRFYCQQVIDQVHPAWIPSKQPIKLIKLTENVDWNYPYTINHAIVLPITFLQSLMTNYQQFQKTSDLRLIQSKINTFFHEMIHILQRYPKLYPKPNHIFDIITTQLWKFHKIGSSQLIFPQIPSSENLNIITNPDGHNFEWIISIHNQWYLPILTRDHHNQLVGCLVKLQKLDNNQYQFTMDWQLMSQTSTYNQRFYGLTKQLYHPNEILCHLMADYLILKHKQIAYKSQPFYHIIDSFTN